MSFFGGFLPYYINNYLKLSMYMCCHFIRCVVCLLVFKYEIPVNMK